MANGTLAASQLEMLSQSGTGIATIVPPATNTNRTLTLPDSTGTLSTLGVGTAVTASGASVDFTDIPSWVKRITVMLNAVSTNGTSVLLFRLGDAGGIEATGYATVGSRIGGSTVLSQSASTGFPLGTLLTSGSVLDGAVVLTLFGSNKWLISGVVTDSGNEFTLTTSGGKTLSDTLTQVRVTTGGGTDTFDAGSINIMYEG